MSLSNAGVGKISLNEMTDEQKFIYFSSLKLRLGKSNHNSMATMPENLKPIGIGEIIFDSE